MIPSIVKAIINAINQWNHQESPKNIVVITIPIIDATPKL